MCLTDSEHIEMMDDDERFIYELELAEAKIHKLEWVISELRRENTDLRRGVDWMAEKLKAMS